MTFKEVTIDNEKFKMNQTYALKAGFEKIQKQILRNPY